VTWQGGASLGRPDSTTLKSNELHIFTTLRPIWSGEGGNHTLPRRLCSYIKPDAETILSFVSTLYCHLCQYVMLAFAPTFLHLCQHYIGICANKYIGIYANICAINYIGICEKNCLVVLLMDLRTQTSRLLVRSLVNLGTFARAQIKHCRNRRLAYL